MRFLWTFFAGLNFAALTLLVSAPLMVGVVMAAVALRGELWTTFSGESFFAVRDQGGNTSAQMVNVSFRTMMVSLPGEMRPRRLLLRLETRNPDVFHSERGQGRVRLDAWHLDDADDLRRLAAYTILTPGNAAHIDEDGLLMVERGGRRTTYSLATGEFLFDADGPLARFTIGNERSRYVAVAAADDDMPNGIVAVLTYANSHHAVRRLLLTAQDPTRARILRTAVTLSRPVARHEAAGTRIIDLALPSGTLGIPLSGEDLDLAGALVPEGMSLIELKPWK